MKTRNRNFLSLWLIVTAAILLSGCAGSPARISMMSDEEIAQRSGAELCNAYAVSGQKNTKIRMALKDRDDLLREMRASNQLDPANGQPPRPPFTKREWEAIDKGNIFIGMSEMGLICAWGWPIPFVGGDVNVTTTRYGVSKQYVYRRGAYSSAQYVYVENGEITAIQQ